jgi:protein gp37
MAATTEIEWTDATWNPVTGCTKISAGCDFCYAERFAERFCGVPNHPFSVGFDLTLRLKHLTQPLAWRQPKMIFVNSMSDLFHKEVTSVFVDRVFDTIERAHWHTFQVLTKRSSRLRDYVNKRYAINGNVIVEEWARSGGAVSAAIRYKDTGTTMEFYSPHWAYRRLHDLF